MLEIDNFSYLKKFFLFVFISNIGNFFQMLYQIFGGKFLSPVDFATLASLNYIIAIVSLPLTIIQVGALRTLNTYKKEQKNKFNYYFQIFFKQNLYFGCIYIPLIVLILREYFNLVFLQDWFITILVLTDLFLVLFLITFNTLLQVIKKYNLISILGALQQFIRLVFYILLYSFFYKSYISGVIGNMLGFFFILVFLTVYFKKNLFGLNYQNQFFLKKKKIIIFNNFNLSTLLIIYVTIINSFDVIIFSKLFEGNITGYYTGISVLSKIPMFISDLIITILFSESVSNIIYKKSNRNLFYSTFLFSFFVYFFVLIIFYFFGETILKIVFNKDYAVYHNELLILGITFSIFSFCKIIVYILISQKIWKFFSLIFLVFLILIYFLLNYSQDISAFIHIILYASIFNFFIVIFFFIKHLKIQNNLNFISK